MTTNTNINKRAGWNKSAGGNFFSKSINVQTKIRPCRVDFFLKINKCVCTSIRYTRVLSWTWETNQKGKNSWYWHCHPNLKSCYSHWKDAVAPRMPASTQTSTLLAIQTRPKSDQIECCTDEIVSAIVGKGRAKYHHWSIASEELYVMSTTGHESPTWLKVKNSNQRSN